MWTEYRRSSADHRLSVVDGQAVSRDLDLRIANAIFAETNTLVRSDSLLTTSQELLVEIGLPLTKNWVLDGASAEQRYGVDYLTELNDTKLNVQAVLPDHVYTELAYNSRFPWLSNRPVLRHGKDYELIVNHLDERDRYSIIFRENTFSDPQHGEEWFYALNVTKGINWFDTQMDVSLLLYEPTKEYHFWLPCFNATGDQIYSQKKATVPVNSRLSFMHGTGIRTKEPGYIEDMLQKGVMGLRHQIAQGVLHKLVITPPKDSNLEYTV